MASCLQVENLTKSYGEQVLFENISFTIEEGLRGRDFSERTKNWIGKAGFGLMLVVFAFAMNNDLTRLFEGA